MDHMDHCPRAQIWRGVKHAGGVALKEWFIVIAADPSSFKVCRKIMAQGEILIVGELEACFEVASG